MKQKLFTMKTQTSLLHISMLASYVKSQLKPRLNSAAVNTHVAHFPKAYLAHNQSSQLIIMMWEKHSLPVFIKIQECGSFT